jgi:hypothetical protein
MASLYVCNVSASAVDSVRRRSGKFFVVTLNI